MRREDIVAAYGQADSTDPLRVRRRPGDSRHARHSRGAVARACAVLVGVAAVTAWFGLGPAALTLALGWAFQLLGLLFVSDDLSLG